MVSTMDEQRATYEDLVAPGAFRGATYEDLDSAYRTYGEMEERAQKYAGLADFHRQEADPPTS